MYRAFQGIYLLKNRATAMSATSVMRTAVHQPKMTGLFTRSMATATTTTPNTEAQPVNDLKYLKFDSNGSNNLYAILRLHNIPYLVTKGDKIVLPVKMKGVKVGDQLTMNNITTIGSPNFTYNNQDGIPTDLYSLKANVVEITKEPYYEVYRKKQRCRRLKTIPVQHYQTVLMINELTLK